MKKQRFEPSVFTFPVSRPYPYPAQILTAPVDKYRETISHKCLMSAAIFGFGMFLGAVIIYLAWI